VDDGELGLHIHRDGIRPPLIPVPAPPIPQVQVPVLPLRTAEEVAVCGSTLSFRCLDCGAQLPVPAAAQVPALQVKWATGRQEEACERIPFVLRSE